MNHPGARRRAGVLLGALLLGFVGLGARLVIVQGMRSEEYGSLARSQRVRKVELPARRGAIYDRNGRELAISVPARTVYANPKHVADPEATATALAGVLGVGAPELAAKLREPRGFVYLARRVGIDVGEKVESLRLAGVSTLDEPRRVYPGGSLASTVVGLVGTDPTGLSGLELSYDSLLRGRTGQRLLEQDPEGRRIPQGLFSEDPPVAGSDLVITLDRDIQFAAEAALQRAVSETGAASGSVVVMDPRNGDLLAMANAPSFDPNVPATIEASSMRNRAVTDVYEPGSVAKIVTAAGVLEEGIASRQTPVEVPGAIRVGDRVFEELHTHAPTLTLEEIISISSNVGTIRLATMLGPKRLDTYLQRMGFGRATSLGVPGEVGGVVPPAARWKTSLPTMAMGQGMSVTALQVVQAYGTVANGGVAVDPRLVAGWVDATGREHTTQPSRQRRVLTDGTAAALRSILASAVASGTGSAAAIPGYPVAGKTGTAQRPSPFGGYSGYVASFVGFVPADAPRVVIGVTLDRPTPIWGAVVAAPVFREVGEIAVRVLRIPPVAVGPPGPPAVTAAAGERVRAAVD